MVLWWLWGRDCGGDGGTGPGWRGEGVVRVQVAVAVAELLAGDGGDAVAGDDDADEVGGIGGGYGDDGSAVAVAGGAEGVDGLGEGELLSAKAGDEASAAEFATGFETPEDAEEIAPAGSVGLAGEEVAEEDAVTCKEHASRGFEGGVGAAGVGDGDGASFCGSHPLR